jgi:steroid 5-alpha reductase family enzyme
MILHELFILFASSAIALLLTVIILWLISIALKDVSIIDMVFPALMAGAVLVAWSHSGARGVIPNLIVALILAWALRMIIYLVWRNLGHGEDPRYTRLRSWVAPGLPFYWLSLRQVFLMQGAIVWVATLPQQIAMANGAEASFGVWAFAGLTLWCVGFFFESVGDYQLSRFKANPDNHGKVMDIGLWRYTRHPNYFGELSQWWGLFFIALEAPWAWCGIIGPLAYSWLIINVTGQATLDKKLAREKPAYADYMLRTSGLIPLLPRQN